MTTIEIFDPPMCCSSGICGPKVDPVLPRFAADLDWVKSQGAAVSRYNLAQQPMAFADNKIVASAMADDENALPLILVDGKIVARGAYPGRQELAEFAGIKTDPNPVSCEKQGGCCCGDDAGNKRSKCCG